MLNQEIIIIGTLFLLIYILYFFNINHRTKVLLLYLVLFELITTFLFFTNKVSIVISTIGILLIFFFTFYFDKGVFNSSLEDRFNFSFSNRINTSLAYKIIGSALILVTLVFEYFFFDEQISSYSGLAIVAGLFWLFYYNWPLNTLSSRDFLLCFLTLALFLFVFPVAIHKFLYSSMGSSRATYLDSVLVGTFLSKPLSFLLNLFGFPVWFEGETIFYPDYTAGHISSLIITTGCSGLFSVGIFVAAFTSYIITEIKTFDHKVFNLYILGIFISYISNLLRMAIIVIVGSYYGSEAMLWTHANAGWIFFTIWLSLFWFIMNKFLLPEDFFPKEQKNE
tara:strand:+ start:2198 stop:3208 length:1011 start_codon:yes stop_codon:yes gene_type:complete